MLIICTCFLGCLSEDQGNFAAASLQLLANPFDLWSGIAAMLAGGGQKDKERLMALIVCMADHFLIESPGSKGRRRCSLQRFDRCWLSHGYTLSRNRCSLSPHTI